MKKAQVETTIKKSRFPSSVFFIFLIILLLMSGVHTGLNVLTEKFEWNQLMQILVPVLYWAAVAGGLTLFTKRRIEKTYDIPMKQLAEATDKVAHGDFSVFVPTTHTIEKRDYLDVMIMDFNKMVKELGSIETLKTDFVSNVSHEIKTPLAIIKNYSTMLKKQDISAEMREEYINTIIGATDKLAALVSNVLKLNRLENQLIEVPPEPFDLCHQLCDCALQYESLWEKKQIQFNVEIEDRAMITADESMLELVWNNLLSNALKFTPPGGTITLCQSSDAHTITVSVSDTGCGMDETTMRHIFDKFYQGDTSHLGEGNGLGLALAQRVVERLDGTLSVKSEIEKGSVFTVTLHLSSL